VTSSPDVRTVGSAARADAGTVTRTAPTSTPTTTDARRRIADLHSLTDRHRSALPDPP
jgi:hypothetical protein